MSNNHYFQLTAKGEQEIQRWISANDMRDAEMHNAYMRVAEDTADECFNTQKIPSLEVLAANSVTGEAVKLELQRDWFNAIAFG